MFGNGRVWCIRLGIEMVIVVGMHGRVEDGTLVRPGLINCGSKIAEYGIESKVSYKN